MCNKDFLCVQPSNTKRIEKYILRRGFSKSQVEKITALYSERNGLVLVCGKSWRKCFKILQKIFSYEYRVVAGGKLIDRQDMRDAIEAAHGRNLVLAAVDACDASECIMRVVHLGIDFAELVSVLRCIIIQEHIRSGEDVYTLTDIVSPCIGLEKVPLFTVSKDELDDSLVHCTNVAAQVLASLKKLPIPDYAVKSRKRNAS